MADEAAAPAANDTATPVAAPTGNVSADDAVAFLRERRNGPSEPATPREEVGAAEQESTSQGEDAGPVEAPGETEVGEEAGEPPLEPPRTWSKAEKEAFAALPRDIQEIWTERERERDTHYQRGLQDAAEQRKAATVERQAAEQARQQYEQALPNLVQQFQAGFSAEFADIKTWEDAEALQRDDPYRFGRYQLLREKGIALTQEAQRVQQQQRQDGAQRWQQFVTDQDARFLEKAPEFKDAKKSAALAVEARTMFNDLGFSGEELTGAWERGQPLSLRDHRVQLLVRDALRYRAAEKARKAAQPKPVPPVQRPGVATSRGDASQATIRDLTNKVKSTGSVDAAVALLRARRKAS